MPKCTILVASEDVGANRGRKDRSVPEYKKGELFDSPGIHIVTASSFISGDGTLVMSMGAGLAMKRRHPELPKVFGALIREYCGHLGKYGLLLCGTKGVLQTRRELGGKMDPELITYGLKILFAVAEGNPSLTYHLSRPGMSLHKLTMSGIDRLLESMPQNVWVWEKE